MKKIDKIKEIMEIHNGILSSKILDENHIHRQYLKNLLEEGYIVKVSRGVYVRPDRDVNEFYIMNQQFKTGIFSHATALYFYNLTDRTPFTLDMTFPSNVRVCKDMLTPHYINQERFELGLTIKELGDGTSIRIYDMERTICDIIRDRNKIDVQIFNTALKEYMKNNEKNLIVLYEYAKKFKILKIVKMYISILA